MQKGARKTENEVLTPAQRWLDLLIVASMLLLLGYLAIHQVTDTGFFTDEFGAREKVALYGPILLALAAPIVRAASGRRNPARPFDAAASLFLAIGSLWLLVVFPFDFPHLADPLPRALRFLLTWVTNGIGKIPLILQIVLSPISAFSTTWRYFAFRGRERADAAHHHTA